VRLLRAGSPFPNASQGLSLCKFTVFRQPSGSVWGNLRDCVASNATLKRQTRFVLSREIPPVAGLKISRMKRLKGGWDELPIWNWPGVSVGHVWPKYSEEEIK